MFKLLSCWILARCPSERGHSETSHDADKTVINTWKVSLRKKVPFSRLNKWMALEAKE